VELLGTDFEEVAMKIELAKWVAVDQAGLPGGPRN